MSIPRITQLLEAREGRDNPDGKVSIMCLTAELTDDDIVPVTGIADGSEIHVVDAAAGFGVFYTDHWYNLATGAVIK